MNCLIKDCQFQSESLLLFARHLRKYHKITSKEYTIKYLLNDVPPICQICENEPRYCSFSFKKYCKEHSHIAEKESGFKGGKNKKTWNKGKTKSSDKRIELSLLNRKYSIEKQIVEIIEFLKKECNVENILREDNVLILLEYSLILSFNNLYKSCVEKIGKRSLLTKTKDGLKNGIKLFHIFSDEWMNKKDIVKSMIKHKLGKTTSKVFARKCEIKIIENVEAKQFFKRTHISGSSTMKKAFGLFFNGKLVCCLALKIPYKARKNNEDHFIIENARFATELNTFVIGGFGKLLKYAIQWSKENGYKKILSYADRRFGEGKVYEKCGFVLKGDTNLDYWYTDFKKRYFRTKFRARFGKTERQIAEENNVVRVYGCGSNIYELNLEDFS